VRFVPLPITFLDVNGKNDLSNGDPHESNGY
jgi:hypothetical protein